MAVMTSVANDLYDEEMSICLLESDLKISTSHANVVSFDENVDLSELVISEMNFFFMNQLLN